MAESPILHLATAMAVEFGIDPVAAMKSTKMEWATRQVALEIIQKQRQADEDKRNNVTRGVED